MPRKRRRIDRNVSRRTVVEFRPYYCHQITLPEYRPIRSVDIPHPADPRRLHCLKQERWCGIPEYSPPPESDLTNAPYGVIVDRRYPEKIAERALPAALHEADNDERTKALTDSSDQNIVSERSLANRSPPGNKELLSSHDNLQDFVPFYKERQDKEQNVEKEIPGSSQDTLQQADEQNANDNVRPDASAVIRTAPSIITTDANKICQTEMRKCNLSKRKSSDRIVRNSVQEARETVCHIDSTIISTDDKDIPAKSSIIKVTPDCPLSKNESLSKLAQNFAHKSENESSRSEGKTIFLESEFVSAKKTDIPIKQTCSSLGNKSSETIRSKEHRPVFRNNVDSSKDETAAKECKQKKIQKEKKPESSSKIKSSNVPVQEYACNSRSNIFRESNISLSSDTIIPKIETCLETDAAPSLRIKSSSTPVQECASKSRSNICESLNVSLSSDAIIPKVETSSETKASDAADENREASISKEHTQISRDDSELLTERVDTPLVQIPVKININKIKMDLKPMDRPRDNLPIKTNPKASIKRKIDSVHTDENVLPKRMQSESEANKNSVINSNEIFDYDTFSENEQIYQDEVNEERKSWKEITKYMTYKRDMYRLLKLKRKERRKRRDRKIEKIRRRFCDYFRNHLNPGTSESEEECQILSKCLKKRKRQFVKYALHDVTTDEEVKDTYKRDERSISERDVSIDISQEDIESATTEEIQDIEDSMSIVNTESIVSQNDIGCSEDIVISTTETDTEENMNKDTLIPLISQNTEEGKYDAYAEAKEGADRQNIVQNLQEVQGPCNVESSDSVDQDTKMQEDIAPNLELSMSVQDLIFSNEAKDGCDVSQKVENLLSTNNDSTAKDVKAAITDHASASKSEKDSSPENIRNFSEALSTPTKDTSSTQRLNVNVDENQSTDDDNLGDIEIEIKIKPKSKSRISRKFSLKAPWCAMNSFIKKLSKLKDNPDFLGELFQMNFKTPPDSSKHENTSEINDVETETSFNVERNTLEKSSNVNQDAESIETASNIQGTKCNSSRTIKENLNHSLQQEEFQDDTTSGENKNTMEYNREGKDEHEESDQQEKTPMKTPTSNSESTKAAHATPSLEKQLLQTSSDESIDNKQRLNSPDDTVSNENKSATEMREHVQSVEQTRVTTEKNSESAGSARGSNSERQSPDSSSEDIKVKVQSSAELASQRHSASSSTNSIGSANNTVPIFSRYSSRSSSLHSMKSRDSPSTSNQQSSSTENISSNSRNDVANLTKIAVTSIWLNVRCCRDVIQRKPTVQCVNQIWMSMLQITQDINNLKEWLQMEDQTYILNYVNQHMTNQPITVIELNHYVDFVIFYVTHFTQTLDYIYTALANRSRSSNVSDVPHGSAASTPNVNARPFLGEVPRASFSGTRMPNPGLPQYSTTSNPRCPTAQNVNRQQFSGNMANSPYVLHSRQPTSNICQQNVHNVPLIGTSGTSTPTVNPQQYLLNANYFVRGQHTPLIDTSNVNNQQSFANMGNVRNASLSGASTSNNTCAYGPARNTSASSTTDKANICTTATATAVKTNTTPSVGTSNVNNQQSFANMGNIRNASSVSGASTSNICAHGPANQGNTNVPPTTDKTYVYTAATVTVIQTNSTPLINIPNVNDQKFFPNVDNVRNTASLSSASTSNNIHAHANQRNTNAPPIDKTYTAAKTNTMYTPIDTSNVNNQPFFANVGNVRNTSSLSGASNIRAHGHANQGNTNAPPTTAINAQQQSQMYLHMPFQYSETPVRPPSTSNRQHQNIPSGKRQTTYNATPSGPGMIDPNTVRTSAAMGNVRPGNTYVNSQMQAPQVPPERRQFLPQYNAPNPKIIASQSAHRGTQAYNIQNILNSTSQQQSQSTNLSTNISTRLISLLNNNISQNVQRPLTNRAKHPKFQNTNRVAKNASSTNPQQGEHQGTSRARNMPQSSSGAIPKTSASREPSASQNTSNASLQTNRTVLSQLLSQVTPGPSQPKETVNHNFDLRILTDMQKFLLRNQLANYFRMNEFRDLSKPEYEELVREKKMLFSFYESLDKYLKNLMRRFQATSNKKEKPQNDTLQNTSVVGENKTQSSREKLTKTQSSQNNENNSVCDKVPAKQSLKESTDSNVSTSSKSTVIKSNLSIEVQNKKSFVTSTSKATPDRSSPKAVELQKQERDTPKMRFKKHSLLAMGKSSESINTSLPEHSNTLEENSIAETSRENSETEERDNIRVNETAKSLMKNSRDKPLSESCSLLIQSTLSQDAFIDKTKVQTKGERSDANTGRSDNVTTESVCETSNVVPLNSRQEYDTSQSPRNTGDQNKQVYNANDEIFGEKSQEVMSGENIEKSTLNSTKIQSDPSHMPRTSTPLLSNDISQSIPPIEEYESAVCTTRDKYQTTGTLPGLSLSAQQENLTNEQSNNPGETYDISLENSRRLHIGQSTGILSSNLQQEQRDEVSSSREDKLDESFDAARCKSIKITSPLSSLLKDNEADLTDVYQSLLTETQDIKRLNKLLKVEETLPDVYLNEQQEDVMSEQINNSEETLESSGRLRIDESVEESFADSQRKQRDKISAFEEDKLDTSQDPWPFETIKCESIKMPLSPLLDNNVDLADIYNNFVAEAQDPEELNEQSWKNEILPEFCLNSQEKDPLEQTSNPGETHEEISESSMRLHIDKKEQHDEISFEEDKLNTSQDLSYSFDAIKCESIETTSIYFSLLKNNDIDLDALQSLITEAQDDKKLDEQSSVKAEETQHQATLSFEVPEDVSSTGENTVQSINIVRQSEDTKEEKIEVDTHSGIKAINERLRHVSEQRYYGKPRATPFIPKSNSIDIKAKEDIKNDTLNADIAECNSVKSDDSEITFIPNILNVRSISPSFFEKIDSIDMHSEDSESLNEKQEEKSLDNTEIPEMEDKPCLRCKRKSTVYCQACLEAHYCSKRCSYLHWNADHYVHCKKKSL